MALLLYSPSSRRNTDPATRRIQQVSHTQPATHPHTPTVKTVACGATSTSTKTYPDIQQSPPDNRSKAATNGRWKRNLKKTIPPEPNMPSSNSPTDWKRNFVKRAAQAEHMHKLITASPTPHWCVATFNSLPSSYTYHTMKGNRLKDGFQTCGHGYMYTFRYFKRLLRIDYIFHSEELEGLDYFSPELDYSDHNPVVMRMKIK